MIRQIFYTTITKQIRYDLLQKLSDLLYKLKSFDFFMLYLWCFMYHVKLNQERKAFPLLQQISSFSNFFHAFIYLFLVTGMV